MGDQEKKRRLVVNTGIINLGGNQEIHDCTFGGEPQGLTDDEARDLAEQIISRTLRGLGLS